MNSQTCDPTEFPSLSPASLLKALTSAQYVSPSSLRRSCHLMKGRRAKVQQKRPTLHGTEGSRRQGQQDIDFVKKTHRKQRGKGGNINIAGRPCYSINQKTQRESKNTEVGI